VRSCSSGTSQHPARAGPNGCIVAAAPWCQSGSVWIPRATDELVAALPAMQESAALDFKAALPQPAKASDIAIDVAAMTTDGGTIVYGVAEDKTAGTFTPTPIPLDGAVERITNAVRSGVGGWVDFEAFTLATSDRFGFVVVAVPMSPGAPHQVIVKNEGRFYGRAPGGNTILGQGDIDRLYERRRRWEEDRAQALDEATGASPFKVQAEPPRGLMHLVVRPIASDGGLRLRVWPSDRQEDLLGALVEAQQALQFTEAWDPKLPDLALGGRFTRTFRGVSLTVLTDPPAAYDQHVEVLDDGAVRYVYGGLMARYQSGTLAIRDTAAAQLTARVLVLAGAILRQGGYLGPVDVAASFQGCEGARSAVWDGPSVLPPIPGSEPKVPPGEHRCHERVSAGTLVGDGAREVARRLMQPFLRTVRPLGAPDPLAV
jgi:hypothetical protein